MRIDRLKAVREARGLSQQDLADRTGISLRQVARYESGENDPTADVLTRIAKALEVGLDYLVGLVDEPGEHFNEEPLSPIERRLIWAVRNGYIVEALETFTAISKASDKTSISSDEPAVNG